MAKGVSIEFLKEAKDFKEEKIEREYYSPSPWGLERKTKKILHRVVAYGIYWKPIRRRIDVDITHIEGFVPEKKPKDKKYYLSGWCIKCGRYWEGYLVKIEGKPIYIKPFGACNCWGIEERPKLW